MPQIPGQSGIICISPASIEHDIAKIFERFDRALRVVTHACVRDIASVRFDISSTIDGYTERVLRALPSTGSHLDAHCEILIATPTCLSLGGLKWLGQYYEERAIEATLAPTRYRLNYFPDLGFYQFFDRKTNRGIQVMTGLNDGPPWDSGSPLRNFLHWRLASSHAGLVHAGTLGRNGQGLLFVGAGGSGKSGTVLAGLLRNWHSVGDDYVLIQMDPKPIAFPLFTTLKQDSSGIARLGLAGHSGIPPKTNWQNKHQFYIGDITPHLTLDPLTVLAICLPKVGDGGPTTVAQASAKEAFLALAPSGVSQIPGDRNATFAIAGKLVRSLPCFHVLLGPDPDEVSAQLGSLLTQVTP